MKWGWRLAAVVAILVLLVFGIVKGGYVYSAVASLLGIFLLATSFLHPSSPEDPRWRVVIFLDARRLLSENVLTVLGLFAFVAMMVITIYLWRALPHRR